MILRVADNKIMSCSKHLDIESWTDRTEVISEGREMKNNEIIQIIKLLDSKARMTDDGSDAEGLGPNIDYIWISMLGLRWKM